MATPANLTEEEVDDILWLSRVDDLAELKLVLDGIVAEKKISKDRIITAAIASDGNTAFHYSSANGHAGILTYLVDLIKPIANGTTSGETNAESSSTSNFPEFLNTKNEAGNTPLHWAAINGHASTLKLLLDAGADAGILNAAGHDAMFEAEINGREEAVELLLREGEGLMASAYGQTRKDDGVSNGEYPSLNGENVGADEETEDDVDDSVTMVEEGMENVQIVDGSHH